MFDTHDCLPNEFPKLAQAVVDVLGLVSLCLGGNDQEAFLVDTLFPQLDKAVSKFPSPQPGSAAHDIPLQDTLGVDFVDILSAWTARPSERKFDLVAWNGELADNKVGLQCFFQGEEIFEGHYDRYVMKSTKKDRLILHVYHGIFLTREQRYQLADGHPVEVVGVSVPVWAHGNDTSEPAVELFCKYLLTNEMGRTNIMPFGEGYTVNIPQPVLNPLVSEVLPDEEWRKMSKDQLERWYNSQQGPRTGKHLRDIQDMGSKYLRFTDTRRMQRDGKSVTVYHVVEIQDIEEMLETLAL